MKYYRLLSMLPALPETPEVPPVSLGQLVELLFEDLDEPDKALAMSLLGHLDCQNVEARLQGYEVFDDRAVLTREALDERNELPEYLQDFLEAHDSGASSDEYPFDGLWKSFYTALVEVAESTGSDFLKDWASYEITLRDALAKSRAESLGEKPELRSAGVAVETAESHAPLLAAMAEAANPMEAERLIDTARLAKIDSISGIDPFSTDAALAYLAATLILDRWDVGKEADVAKMLEVFA